MVHQEALFLQQIMSLYVASLNSGSNGNCYYIGNDKDAVLIDAGLSCRETERRMRLLGLSMDRVRAIFISHEHTDHLRGLHGLLKKHPLPVYFSQGTLAAYRRQYSAVHHYLHFEAETIISIGSLDVLAFSKKHDAADPYSFTITQHGFTVGVITDIGIVCNNVQRYFSKCHVAFLEANYDEDMLQNGSYPYHLKHRIRGGMGHISNAQAFALFAEHKHPQLSHIFLSHLSKENNNPELAKNLFETAAGKTNIIVASRYEPTEVYHFPSTQNKPTFLRKESLAKTEQLSLFL